MHYRNAAVNFLEPPDSFYEAFGGTAAELPRPEFVVDEHLGDKTVVVAPAPPLGD